MGIFGAMTTAVAGLRSQAFALENISGNIAGSQTTGFKRIDTSFLDLVPETGVVAQLSGSVTGVSRQTNTVKGDVQQVNGEKTFMAINGEGFFVVQKPASFSDNSPIFDGVDRFTRRGDFTRDKDGFLVNKAGYFLEGIPIDPVTGNPLGNTPQVLQFSNDFLPAKPTTAINYRANLPENPKTTRTTSVPGSELLKPTDFAEDPSIIGTPVTLLAGATAVGKARFNNTTPTPAQISGGTLLSGGAGAITTPFAVGNEIRITDTSVSPATTQLITFIPGVGPTGSNNTIGVGEDITSLLNKIDALTTTPGVSAVAAGVITLQGDNAKNFQITSPQNPQALLALGFGGSGQISAAEERTFVEESVGGGSITGFDVTGSPVNFVLRWAKLDSADLGAGHTDKWNLFYLADPNATGTATKWVNVGKDFFFQNGVQAPPPVASVTINNPTIDGVTLTNPVTFTFGDTGLTQFDDTDGAVSPTQFLQDGSAAGQLVDIAVSDEGRVVGSFSNGENRDLAQITLATFSGANFLKRIDGGAFEATDASGLPLFTGGGSINGSHLEGSNADIADEFTKLIVTQQAYSANSKIISAANQMSQDLLNVIR